MAREKPLRSCNHVSPMLRAAASGNPPATADQRELDRLIRSVSAAFSSFSASPGGRWLTGTIRLSREAPMLSEGAARALASDLVRDLRRWVKARDGEHWCAIALEEGPRLGLHLHLLCRAAGPSPKAQRERIEAFVAGRLGVEALRRHSAEWGGHRLWRWSTHEAALPWLAYMAKGLVPAGEVIEGVVGRGDGLRTVRSFTFTPEPSGSPGRRLSADPVPESGSALFQQHLRHRAADCSH